jgi:hypothetical protein
MLFSRPSRQPRTSAVIDYTRNYMPDKVLDIDLDAFVWPIAHWPPGGRLNSETYTPWSHDSVERFLTEQCALEQNTPLPGRRVRDHDEAFDTWLEWLEQGILAAPFEVIHVDAHADLGLGDSSWVYLMTELLAQPPQNRVNPRRGPSGLNAGSYLAFAVAAQWVGSLTYVYPPSPKIEPTADVSEATPIQLQIVHENGSVEMQELRLSFSDGNENVNEPGDLHSYHFQDFDTQAGMLQLKYYANRPDDPRLAPPNRLEPPVPFRAVRIDQFAGGDFTHVILAESPDFTPPSADALLPAIEKFFRSR